MNNNNEQIIKKRDIYPHKSGLESYVLFPYQYINQKCILISKNGEYANKEKQTRGFLTEQSIHFGISSLQGIMSNHGEYLVTWIINKSKQIQIRRFTEF
ncbi:unnamed protein product [Paramecium pentaurelia]|uniref:Uncharacterized protein n=1 Tax=Paramecium pentaurelia TaxID=43138 RepID=A0A8S1YHR1_9CILI|nr:unnamed protein product [Paramecium pentaurelia]